MSAQPETGLYRRFDLLAAPQKNFAMCSSEEAADAFQKLQIDGYIATSWPRTPGAWKWADLSVLVGRTGLLVSDASAEARQDMESMAERLATIGCKLRITDTSSEQQDWTLCDWTGEAAEFIAWAKLRTADYVPRPQPVEPEPDEEIGAGEDEELPPIESYEQDAPPRRQRPHLAIVDGTAALQPQEAPAAEPIPFSEDQFGSRFADQHGENWRCVEAWGKWFNWDGEAWAEDRTKSRVQPMRELLREARDWPEARGLTPSTLRSLGRKVTAYASLELAGTDQRIRAEPEIWDADPWALGVPGGVVDLQSGKLVESARDQHVTMRCTVAPDRGEPTLWLKLLRQWMGEDEDIIGFLRRYLGYALTGDSREQCMVFFYGQAQSGKGTILRTISGILGTDDQASRKFRSYHYEAPISTFMESRNDRHTTELAAFYKKRLITAEEPNAGAKWDEGKLKWITGGSQITARFIGQDNFSFTMTGKIIVAANHRPRLATTDKAIRRRMLLVPFEHPVTDADRDNTLDAQLRAEWPKILHWLIQGSLEWQDCGLGLPERISAATDQYLESEDTLGSWLEECCERSQDTDGQMLYNSYAAWCTRNGDNAWSRRAWSNALVERGFQIRRSTGGTRFVRGLSVRIGSNLP